jgi:hypothetical protein
MFIHLDLWLQTTDHKWKLLITNLHNNMVNWNVYGSRDKQLRKKNWNTCYKVIMGNYHMDLVDKLKETWVVLVWGGVPKYRTSVVKIASWLAESAEFTTYPSLSERNRAQNRRRRGSVPDRRSESHNRRNGVRSDSDQCARGGRKKRVVLVFYQTHRFVIITKQKRTVSFIWLFLILFYFLN